MLLIRQKLTSLTCHGSQKQMYLADAHVSASNNTYQSNETDLSIQSFLNTPAASRGRMNMIKESILIFFSSNEPTTLPSQVQSTKDLWAQFQQIPFQQEKNRVQNFGLLKAVRQRTTHAVHNIANQLHMWTDHQTHHHQPRQEPTEEKRRLRSPMFVLRSNKWGF